MIRPPDDGVEVYLCVEPVDFRRQITGLATLVQDRLEMDPFSAKLFVFANRRGQAAGVGEQRLRALAQASGARAFLLAAL